MEAGGREYATLKSAGSLGTMWKSSKEVSTCPTYACHLCCTEREKELKGVLMGVKLVFKSTTRLFVDDNEPSMC